MPSDYNIQNHKGYQTPQSVNNQPYAVSFGLNDQRGGGCSEALHKAPF